MKVGRFLAICSLLLLLPACSPEPGASGEVDPGDTPDVGIEEDMEGQEGITWHNRIFELVESNCATCHIEGGIAPYPMDTLENVRAIAPAALSSMQSGNMPPWLPDPECRTFKDQRVLAPGDIDDFETWIQDGMPEGTPVVRDEPVAADWPAPDVIGRTAGAYTPRDNGGDDYRCFLLDLEFPDDLFITALDVDPGNTALTHHANMFLVNPANVATIQRLEDEHDDPGYPCFGSPGINNVNLVGAWVPGMEPIELPENMAVRIPQGSRIVMQGHFNTSAASAEPVSPSFLLWTMDGEPEMVVRAMPFADTTFVIEAGDEHSEHIQTFRNLGNRPWTVIGTAAHLHLLATVVRLEILPQDGEDMCLLDIPAWDFNWQQAYFLPDGEWLEVQPRDRVRLNCTFDNSPENQPIVDGMRRTPQDTRWGGGTYDEMCITFLIVAEPWEPSEIIDGELCEHFRSCRDECDDPFGVGCIFNCGAEELTCGECLLMGAQRCANLYCRDEMTYATPCLLRCAQGAQAGGDIDACLVEECPEERDALETCIRPRIEGGFCNDYIASCNLEF